MERFGIGEQFLPKTKGADIRTPKMTDQGQIQENQPGQQKIQRSQWRRQNLAGVKVRECQNFTWRKEEHERDCRHNQGNR
jgi:hypothetical protein